MKTSVNLAKSFLPLEKVSKAVLPILHIYRKLQNVQVERVLITASVHQNGSRNQSFAEPRRETGYKFLRLCSSLPGKRLSDFNM